MPNAINSSLWLHAFASRNEPIQIAEARERLRSSLLRMRERAEHLATFISRDLPDYTVHDVTHLDALWDVADHIVGENFSINPAEAFVLGGAFLLHDIGMSLAAYPEGIRALKQNSLYVDTFVSSFRERFSRLPTLRDFESPPIEIEKRALDSAIRGLHAQQAERLAHASWLDVGTGQKQFLIEDSEIRQTYGALIGRIAHSHWWSIARLQTEFTATLGASVWCPHDWTIDSLRLACLLRTADAAHIDARRAPTFLRVLRNPSGDSAHHWRFQELLNRVQNVDGRLVYTSGHRFEIVEAPAWWLCFETLRMIDKELRGVDAVLADSGRGRFKARSVAGVEDPRRLTEFISTTGWIPIDTHVRVGDVPKLVQRLGGRELYGDDPTIPLRELIQNGADAIRARRLIESRDQQWGEILVCQGSDSHGEYIDVQDNGIGMSLDVLIGPLLDFGTSYWGSWLMQQEHPGLLSKGFQPTGKYGIGFFSAFMWGKRIQIITRRYDSGLRDTLVLEFLSGPGARPILRPAKESEFLRDGGTTVRVWLDIALHARGGLLSRNKWKNDWTLTQLCKRIGSALDVNLYTSINSNLRELIIAANDWGSVDGLELLRRIWYPEAFLNIDDVVLAKIRKIADNLRPIQNSSGELVGRVCVCPDDFIELDGFYDEIHTGAVYVGGLRANGLLGIAGVLLGVPVRAARDEALPVVEAEPLQRWASEQANTVSEVCETPDAQLLACDIIRRCGGDTGQLVVAYRFDGWISSDRIAAWQNIPDEILLAPTDNCLLDRGRPVELARNVLGIFWGGRILMRSQSHWNWPEHLYPDDGITWFGRFTDLRSAEGAVIEALACAWKSSARAVLDASSFPNGLKRNGQIIRSIGRTSSGDVETSVMIIRRPKVNSIT